MVEQAEQIAEISPVDREYLPTLEQQTYKPVKRFCRSDRRIFLSTNRAKSIGDILKQSEKSGVISAGFHQARAQAGGFCHEKRKFRF